LSAYFTRDIKTIIALYLVAPPTIQITQNPDTRYVARGDNVVLQCEQVANPDLQEVTFYWLRGNVRREGATYNVASATEASTGLYTCVAEANKDWSSSINVTQKWFLKVQCK
jgi:hypothetical protein